MADWLLGKAGVLDALHAALIAGEEVDRLRHSEFIEGPVRFLASENGTLLLLWHADYLSGTGDEDWGFITLTGELGILERGDMSRGVLERCIYVLNQRLQGYLLDGALIHRSQPNGTHTCLAGRGSEARHLSVGYVENEVSTGSTSVHAVLCVGPSVDRAALSSGAAQASLELPRLVRAAGLLIDPTRRRSAAPPEVMAGLHVSLGGFFEIAPEIEYGEVSVTTGSFRISDRDSYRTVGWTYDDWTGDNGCLSLVQRRLLDSDALERHPIRIVGPGGSGKTLLMQLLALRRFRVARDRGEQIRILYLAHNAKMAESIRHRFSVLQGVSSDFASPHQLVVQTLAEYGRHELSLDETQVIDADAHEAKEFQSVILGDALDSALRDHPGLAAASRLFTEVQENPILRPVLIRMLMAEVSTAIKGHGLQNDERRYIQSERRLSRLHGVLTPDERRIVFDAFRYYHHTVFESYRVLDSDDIALSLLGKLRAPIWSLKRRELGFDYVFVDETQLFNENERRILPLLTKTSSPHVPIVLALDEAQDLYGQSSAGLAALGIENVTSESLSSIHRSTRAIVKLAFFVIQRSTDLFGPDFPDFTGIAEQMEADTHPLAATPSLDRVQGGAERMGRFVLKRIRALRRDNLWRIAVVNYAEQYWLPVSHELRKSDLPLRVIETRGERIPAAEPVVVLSRPQYIGGQEFDAVILVGVEQGLVPPRIIDNDALAVAVEQQSLRELYLGITRARYQLRVVIAADALPSPILADAIRSALLVDASNDSSSDKANSRAHA